MRSLLLGLCLLLGGCSQWLFYPQAGLPVTPAVLQLDYRDVYLQAADGTRLHAWWLPAAPGVAPRGTVLHLHGNAGNLAWHLQGVAWLPAQGYQVLMLDYRGYGLSAGQPSLPAVYQDIDAAFAWLEQAPAVQGKPLTLLGQSLGGALAVHYLAQHAERRERLQGLVLDGVPARYRDVARDVLSQSWLTWPLQVPLSWLVPDGDSAIDSIAQLEPLPLLIFHSLDDKVVAFSNGDRLHRAARSPRRFIETRGGHVQTFTEDTWRQALLAFLHDPQVVVDSSIPPVPETPQ